MSDNTDQPLPPINGTDEAPPADFCTFVPSLVLSYLLRLSSDKAEQIRKVEEEKIEQARQSWTELHAAAVKVVDLEAGNTLLSPYLPKEAPAGWLAGADHVTLRLTIPGMCPVEFSLGRPDGAREWELCSEWEVVLSEDYRASFRAHAKLEDALLCAWDNVGDYEQTESGPPTAHSEAPTVAPTSRHDDEEIPF